MNGRHTRASFGHRIGPGATAALAALLLAAQPTPDRAASTITWTIDPGHSIAQFTALHFMITKVHGSILVKQGTIVTAEGSTVPISISAVLDATSEDTRNPDRDGDLKGPDWLDVGKYPAISFASTKIEPADNGALNVIGNLTIHGVTKPVTLTAHFDGQTVDGRGHHHASYSASTTIDRRDFGLNWAQTMPGGTLIVSNQVDIDVSVDAIAR